MHRLTTLAILSLSFALAGCDIEDIDSGGKFESNFHYNYPLSNGASVNVETFNGQVEIVGWDQNAVDISGTKYARTEQLRDDIKIDVSHSNSSVSVRAIRPSSISHGNMGARFVIHVPKKADLQRVVSSNGAVEVRDVAGSVNLHTSNGRIKADSIDGPLDATTSNGKIDVRESGPSGHNPVHLHTSNGTIEVTAESKLTGDVHATTSNGSITLHMPSTTEARVRASTSNSSISSDFDVTMHGRIDKHHMEGNINDARSDAPLLELSTSNGSIHLSKL